MSDGDIIWHIRTWGVLVGMFTATLCIAGRWAYERLLDAWTLYRLRVRRRTKRADYIRWWTGVR